MFSNLHTPQSGVDINQLIDRNKLPRKQRGQRVETPTSWGLRYYQNGQQKYITLATKNDQYRSWTDVEPLITKALEEINEGREIVTSQEILSEFIEKHYLPWCDANKAAPTANAYKRIWHHYWKPHIGGVMLQIYRRRKSPAFCRNWRRMGRAVAHSVTSSGC